MSEISHDDWYALCNERDKLMTALQRIADKGEDCCGDEGYYAQVVIRDVTMRRIRDKAIDEAVAGMQVAAAFKQPELVIDAVAGSGGKSEQT